MNHCVTCGGTGTQLGLGMLYQDCVECFGAGSIYIDTAKHKASSKPDKRSKAYRDAVNMLMRENAMSREDAEELFLKTLEGNDG